MTRDLQTEIWILLVLESNSSWVIQSYKYHSYKYHRAEIRDSEASESVE